MIDTDKVVFSIADGEPLTEQTMFTLADSLVAPETFKKLRLAKKLTRKELARHLDCSEQTIIGYERSGCRLSVDRYLKFLFAVAQDDDSKAKYSTILQHLRSQMTLDMLKGTGAV
ncbi:helix-turn-helix domain-containing protein [Aliiglaciecola lipolytica]|uniref:HTH cro/C1-type domain-containing protein n=1 Tax=Aliiglaciecola lipolytica E3 TaxID=1127673 RepID=K6Y557_9ALTE|nr:helix-turn-helix transcriptional regulator [Aliiglaciecola lipolytica]GAC13372.1 hypothetical protein GLIP_0726 [Aliiglaciecola lipolytica E3]